MEKKIKFLIELTPKEVPLLQAYCNGLADGNLDPNAEATDDHDAVLAVCKAHMPELKSILYQLTGEGLKTMSQFFRDARILAAKHESVRVVAQEAEDWAAEVLGYREAEEEHDENETS